MSRKADVPVRAVRRAIVLMSARATSPAASREMFGLGLVLQGVLASRWKNVSAAPASSKFHREHTRQSLGRIMLGYAITCAIVSAGELSLLVRDCGNVSALQMAFEVRRSFGPFLLPKGG